MKHIRTTVPGVGLVLGGIISLGSMLLGGKMPTAEQWQMFGAAIVTGCGLIAAADGKNVDVPAALPAPVTPPQEPPR